MTINCFKNFCKNNLFIFFYILLFSIILGRSSLEITASIGMIIGIYLLICHWKQYITELSNSRYLYVNLAFLIPIAISLIDALNMGQAVSVFLQVLRYLFLGIFAVAITYEQRNYQRLVQFSFYTILLICVDAIIQWLTDYNIYGYNPVVNFRVRGVFKVYHLSYFLGTFTPVILFYLYQKISERYTHLRALGVALALILFITAIILGGARAGIVSFSVSVFLFIIYLFINGKIKHKARFIGFSLISLVLALGIASQSEIVQKRFHQTTAAFGKEHFIDQFLSGRTNIWHVAVEEIPNHLINGVGPRGFNSVYQTYPDNYKIYKYVAQPHLHGFEVLIETGLLGFIPYLLVLIYLLKRMFVAQSGNMWIMMGFVAMMPINSHVGLYQGYWMPLIWIPIMIGLTQAYRIESLGKDKG